MSDVGASPDLAGGFAAPIGTRFTDVRWHGELDSTNRALVELARAGAPEGVVVGADHQTAGRGRRGRSWVAPAGTSLLVSVLLRPPLPPDRIHLVTAAVGLAACDACVLAAGFRPWLKWPNDIVVLGSPAASEAATSRKLGGILAEADVEAGEVRFVVVGLGLNVSWPAELPAELEALSDTAIAVSHRAAGRPVDRSTLLAALLSCLEDRYRALCGGPGGWASTLAAYRRCCCTLGRRVRAEQAEGTVEGTAVDVTVEGHLVLELGGGGGDGGDRDVDGGGGGGDDDGARRRVALAVGDVVHLRESSVPGSPTRVS